MKHPIDEWKALWESGKSFAQIAEQYGVTKGTVAGQKWRFQNPEKARDYSFSKARENSASQWKAELDRRRERYGHLLSVVPAGSTKAKAIAGFLDGKTVREIGHGLGVSCAAVWQHLASVGIKGTSRLHVKTRPFAMQEAA